MKIVKKPNGYQYAVFKGGQEISTRTKNREKAQQIAKEGNWEALDLASQAQALTADVITRLVSGGKKVTMQEAVDLWGKRMSMKGRANKTIHNNVTAVERWLELCSLTRKAPAFVEHKHIHNYANSDKAGNKASSRRVVLSSIRGFIEFCCGEGWRVGNPANDVGINLDLMDHNQKESKSPTLFTENDIRHLIAVVDDAFWRFAIQLSYETGLRLGDICQLEWECIDEGHITVWTDKRNKRVGPFKLSSRLESMLIGLPVLSPKYIFPDQREKQRDPKRRAHLSVQFKRYCESAGLSDRSFHGLRHTYASVQFKAEKEKLVEKLKRELAEVEVAQKLGHSSTETTKGYIH